MSINYRLDEWIVRPHRNRIERGSESVHLGPKAMAVLDCLASASNSVVTRQEIFDSVWPSATVADEVLTQRIAEIRKAFGDSAQQPKIIETIPKIGFRLIPPVIPLSQESVADRELHKAAGPRHALRWLVFVAACLLMVMLLLKHFRVGAPAIEDSSTETRSPSIAVLPFVNISEDLSNEYFSDGISEELINLLANVPGLDVTSRSSSFYYKDKNLKTADIASELNVSLILEGSVRKIENRVRITAQLIDPATDKHLMSESYDRELSHIFSLQEEIAQSIVTTLQDKIGVHTVVIEPPTENMEAYEFFLQGRHLFYQRGPALDRAIMLLKMAVREDPEFAEAWTYLTAATLVVGFYRTSINNEVAWKLADEASTKMLVLNLGSGFALAAKAMLAYGYEGDLKKGFQLIDRAVDEAPHDTTVRLWAGMYNWYWGYLEEAHSHFLYAYTRDPRMGITNGSLGLVYLAQGREDLAAPRLDEATELGYPNHYHVQTCVLMRGGDFDAAITKLKIILTSSGTNADLLPWIYELEEAGRSYVANPASADALIAVVERAPKLGITEKAMLTLLFDLKDRFFEYFPLAVEEGPLWLPYVLPILWLPEYRSYIEDPRFFEIMRRDGAVDVWEQRGYLDGCVRVNDPAGDHLDCSQRYQ